MNTTPTHDWNAIGAQLDTVMNLGQVAMVFVVLTLLWKALRSSKI